MMRSNPLHLPDIQPPAVGKCVWCRCPSVADVYVPRSTYVQKGSNSFCSWECAKGWSEKMCPVKDRYTVGIMIDQAAGRLVDVKERPLFTRSVQWSKIKRRSQKRAEEERLNKEVALKLKEEMLTKTLDLDRANQIPGVVPRPPPTRRRPGGRNYIRDNKQVQIQRNHKSTLLMRQRKLQEDEVPTADENEARWHRILYPEHQSTDSLAERAAVFNYALDELHMSYVQNERFLRRVVVARNERKKVVGEQSYERLGASSRDLAPEKSYGSVSTLEIPLNPSNEAVGDGTGAGGGVDGDAYDAPCTPEGLTVAGVDGNDSANAAAAAAAPAAQPQEAGPGTDEEDEAGADRAIIEKPEKPAAAVAADPDADVGAGVEADGEVAERSSDHAYDAGQEAATEVSQPAPRTDTPPDTAAATTAVAAAVDAGASADANAGADGVADGDVSAEASGDAGAEVTTEAYAEENGDRGAEATVDTVVDGVQAHNETVAVEAETKEDGSSSSVPTSDAPDAPGVQPASSEADQEEPAEVDADSGTDGIPADADGVTADAGTEDVTAEAPMKVSEAEVGAGGGEGPGGDDVGNAEGADALDLLTNPT